MRLALNLYAVSLLDALRYGFLNSELCVSSLITTRLNKVSNVLNFRLHRAEPSPSRPENDVVLHLVNFNLNVATHHKEAITGRKIRKCLAVVSDILWPVMVPFLLGPSSAEHAEHA